MGTGTPRHHLLKGRERFPCGTPEEASATLAKRFEERPSDLKRLMEAARFGVWVGAQIAWLAKSLPYVEKVNAAIDKIGPPPGGFPDGARPEFSWPLTWQVDPLTDVPSRPPTGPESLAAPQTVFCAIIVALHLTKTLTRLGGLAPLRQSPLADELGELSDARIPMAAATLAAARRMGCKVPLGPIVLCEFSMALGLEKRSTEKRKLLDSWRKRMPAIKRAERFFDEKAQAEKVE